MPSDIYALDARQAETIGPSDVSIQSRDITFQDDMMSLIAQPSRSVLFLVAVS